MRKTNGYGWYTAEYCKSTGLPMYNKKSYEYVADKYLSKTRCARIKKPVKADEEPVAFYRVDRGYCGLYLREEGGGADMRGDRGNETSNERRILQNDKF